MTVPLISYSHRSKPYASEAQFVLEDDHVAITQGSRSGNFPYRDVVFIRLLYKPRNTTNEGYQAKLYRRDKKTAALTNLSWKSLVDLDRQDAPYDIFVRALIKRTAEVNPSVVLEAGMPRWLHLITAGAGLLAILALVYVTAQSILNGSLPVALLTGALTLYFGWWAKRYLGRNRPRLFTSTDIPAEVMPPAPSSR